MSDWTIAALPLLGVAFGAALQFWLSRAAEREKHGDAQRPQAYADYLQAVAAAAHRRSDEDLRDANRNYADAKARFAVYGTAAVVRTLARFEELGAVVRREGASATAFIALVAAMRFDGDAVQDEDLKLVLLGLRERRKHGGS